MAELSTYSDCSCCGATVSNTVASKHSHCVVGIVGYGQCCVGGDDDP